MATSLALAREPKKRKRENIKNKLERMQSAKKQKLDKPFNQTIIQILEELLTWP